MLSRDPVAQGLLWRLVAERGVAATLIVKDLDISKEVGDRCVPRAMHSFVLQAIEEADRRGVIPAIEQVLHDGRGTASLRRSRRTSDRPTTLDWVRSEQSFAPADSP